MKDRKVEVQVKVINGNGVFVVNTDTSNNIDLAIAVGLLEKAKSKLLEKIKNFKVK